MTKEELLAEEYICNGKCQDDITRNYVHCKTCTRLEDFLAGYKAGIAELKKENTELEAQIEKMKCCTNCRYCIKEWGEVNPNSPNCKKCHNKSNWQLRR